MKRIKIAILDDDKNQIDLLEVFCKEYFDKKSNVYKIETFNNEEEFLLSNLDMIDILLLDIEMPNYNGIQIAHKVRTINKKCFICFITNYLDYLYESYDVHAFDYLMKPIEKERLFTLLDEVVQYRNVQQIVNKQKLTFNTTSGEIIIDQSEIMYFEYQDKFKNIFNRVTLMYTSTKTYILREKISDVYNKLSNDFFIIPHQSFIVNMDNIKLFKQNEIIMINDVLIPLSRKRAANARKKFSQHVKLFYNKEE